MRWTAAFVLCLCGCLQVDPFAGSWIAMSMTWPPTQPAPLPAGEHLEIWAQYGEAARPRFERLVTELPVPGRTFPGFALRPAISPNDPCLIRGMDRDDEACAGPDADPTTCGAHLLSADGQARPGDTPQERHLRQLALVEHVRQVVPKTVQLAAFDGTTSGRAPIPLWVLAEHQPEAQPPPLSLEPGNAGSGPAAAERFRRCRASLGDPRTPYLEQPNPAYYLGNPKQLTKPLHGVLYGFFNFCTTPDWPQDKLPPTTCAIARDLPPQNFGSITLATPQSLSGLVGLLITRETAGAPGAPGTQVVARGVPVPGGRGALRFALVITVPGPMGTPQTVTVGTASVLTDLDQEIE
jgi:hypothetical protein